MSKVFEVVLIFAATSALAGVNVGCDRAPMQNSAKSRTGSASVTEGSGSIVSLVGSPGLNPGLSGAEVLEQMGELTPTQMAEASKYFPQLKEGVYDLSRMADYSSLFGKDSNLMELAGARWSYKGAIAGLTCLQFAEPSDPDYWNDNFLCRNGDMNLRWSHAGPIDGMHCVQIYEGSDPHTWDDNYLCSPTDIGLRWSSSGPIRGAACLQINEPSDPHTWDDNYLCLVLPGVPAGAVETPATDTPNAPSSDQLVGELQSNASLGPGQTLESPNGQYTLAHQHDGNVVLYGPSGVLWATNTAQSSTSTFIMQADGNLVLYSTTGEPLWASNTSGYRGARLVLGDDGSLSIYMP